MEFRYQPTFKEQYDASMAVLIRTRVRAIAALLFPAAAILLVALLVYLRRPPTFPQAIVIIAALGFVHAVTALNVWLFRRKNRTVTGTHVMVLDDSGIRIQGPHFDMQLKWEGIAKIVETRKFFLFFISSSMAQFLPKRVIGGEKNLEALRRLFESVQIGERLVGA